MRARWAWQRVLKIRMTGKDQSNLDNKHELAARSQLVKVSVASTRGLLRAPWHLNINSPTLPQENKYSWTGGILKRKGKVVVGNDLELRKELVQHFHDEAIGGYSGAHVTMKKLESLFYWKCLKKMVKQMMRL
nr:reverse transcriptase [Tanacetum cinerariifolium]